MQGPFTKAIKDKDSRKLAVFPTFNKVAGRIVLVVGCGDEAAAKVRLLSETQAHIRVVAPNPEDTLVNAVTSSGAELIREQFTAAHLNGAVLVFAASGELDIDRAVVKAGKAAGIPSNAVDSPELCDFYVGALVNRAPIAVAVTSTGVGPVYARHIRASIEALLPLEAGRLARLAEGFRATASKLLQSGEEKRRFWARFFSGSIAANVLAGREEKARLEAQRLLNGADDSSGYVWIVGAGPGAEDLLTLRAQRVLQEADIIFYDALVPKGVVAMGRRDAQRVSVGKRKGSHSVSQVEINERLITAAKAGQRVVRLKAGDPLVFGRAGEEMEALRAAGVDHEIVPGITAAFAAASSAQIPLTLRGVASSLVFATGHNQVGETLPDWAQLTLTGTTTAVYMGRTVAARVATQLLKAGLEKTTGVVAIENASQPEERIFLGDLGDLPRLAEREEVEGPVLIIIGDVVRGAALEKVLPLAPKTMNEKEAVAAA
ncbi:siroheme synthase CysG [Flexibacterium corallicola]|uniref:siroheme synthase CysG n=1 Tax=Flexibacterium corallicola TaxID=3037259 RepID=UPI00286EE55C|nr:siroheme synthase CysG [Pseudovibrio sp. M1P-2-3]